MACINYKSPEVQEIAKAIGESAPVAAAMINSIIERHNQNSFENDITGEGSNEYFPSVSEVQEYKKETAAERKLIYQTTLKAVTPLEQVFAKIDPVTRKNRATLIASLFSSTLDDLEAKYPGKTRAEIIDIEKPAGIFNEVKAVFQDMLDFDDLSESQQIEVTKVIDNFEALASLAANDLLLLEGVKFGYNSNKVAQANFNDESPDGTENDEANGQEEKEEQVKEGWMVNYMHQSAHASLSQKVRKLLARIERLDFEGKTDIDDLGFKRYLDPQTVHNVLINKLRFMNKSSDVLVLLKQLATNKPWVNNIITALESDNSLLSSFYSDMRKDATLFSIQKVTSKAGRNSYKTVEINNPEGYGSIIDNLKDNINSSTILSTNSIYDNAGKINQENVERNRKKVRELTASLKENIPVKASSEVEGNYITEWVGNNIDTIHDLVTSTGLEVDKGLLQDALTYNLFQDNKLIRFTPSIITTLDSLQTMFDIASKYKPEFNEKNEEKRVDFYKLLGSKYNSIAKSIGQVTEDNIESSVFENGKSYYSHLVPSYIAKQINKFKNEMHNDAEFDEFIDNEFKKVSWFYRNGEFQNEWLKLLASKDHDGVEARALLNRKVMLNFNKVNYSNLSDLDYTIALINEFFSDSNANSAWYHVPILSDAPVGEFIKFKRYTDKNIPDKSFGTYKNYLLDKFVNVAVQELHRMDIVAQRKVSIKNNTILPINNFDKRGESFQFFPSLNSELDIIKQLVADNGITGSEVKDFLYNRIESIINDKFQETLKDWKNIGLFDTVSKSDTSLRYLNIPNGAHENTAIPVLENYFWNSMFATSQIIQLTTTDLAYYKNIEDFQKRNKQIHAPAMRGNTEATWTSIKEIDGKKVETVEKVGRENERTVTLKDNNVKSEVYEEIKAALEAKVNSGDLDKYDAAEILAGYGVDDKGEGKVNQTDAQAYRSLKSYRRVMIMFGKWNQSMEESYDRFNKGTWDMNDYKTIWQPFKPFMYTQKVIDSGVKDKSGNPIYIKTPIQHKNSEFLLLPTKGIIANSPKLQGISDFMNGEDDIDVVQFESTVKDGLQGAIDINDYNDRKQIKDILHEAINNEVTGSQSLHEVPYGDYGIQQEVPEHSIDTTSGFGTQIRKLVFSDMDDNEVIDVELASGKKLLKSNGTPYTKGELHNLYKEIITANIIDSFKSVSDIFNDPMEVERILQEEVKGSSRFGNDMLLAVTLVDSPEEVDAEGNVTKPAGKVFNIPLFEPSQSQRVQTLVNSVIKSRVTKQQIKGGSLVQVSRHGSPDLQIKFRDSQGNIMINPTDEEKKNAHSIAYFECFMPWYTQKFFKEFMDKNGELDINKRDKEGNYVVPEELRKLIGYRIPTEDKYSMTPLYIKGFLPQNSGGAIMLPSEITTISGSDFDVDKMYVMMPEFAVDKNYNIKEAWKDFYEIHPEIHEEVTKALALDKAIISKMQKDFSNSELIEGISERFRGYELVEGTLTKFKEWFQGDNKEKYLDSTKIRKRQFDFSKSVLKNKVAERNNLMLDIMYGILTNHNNVHKMLNPGGFDKQKKAARIVTLLKTIDFFEKDEQGRYVNKAMIQSEKYNQSLYTVLNNMSLNDLNTIANIYKSDLDILNPRTQVNLHQQNTTAGKLIGIYANHNANHALMQDTQLELSDKGTFNFLYGGNNKLKSLHSIKAPDGSYISRNNAGFLAASVDAVKDPVLNYMNLNTFTADASMLLSRLGYTPNEIGMLLSQPIVQKMTELYFRENKNGMSKEDIIDKIMTEYGGKEGGERLITMNMLSNGIVNSNRKVTISRGNEQVEIPVSELTAAERLLYIQDHKDEGNYGVREYYNDQVDIGFLFKKITASAQALADLTSATRADTAGGGAGPTIADTINKITKVKDFNEKTQSEKSLLSNANLIKENMQFEKGTNESLEENMMKQIMETPLPYVQAFYTLGVEKTNDLLSKYFPHYKPEFQYVIDSLKNITKSGKLDVKTMNSIYNDLFAYILNSTEFFGNKNVETALQDADDLINKFPDEFSEAIENNPRFNKIDLINSLRVITEKDTGMSILAFRNVGGLSTEQRENISNSWTSLLYSGEEGKELALKLFKYSYYRNGFAFGPNTFMHLAPVQIKQAIPGYIEGLRQITDVTRPNDYYKEFITQYLLNHTDNRRLVAQVDSKNTTYGKSFYNEENVIKDTVSIQLHKNSSTEDKTIAISTEYNKETGLSVDFKPVISVDYKNGTEVFVLDEINTTPDTAYYVRRDKLGLKNNFLQYSFGTDASELHNVINKAEVTKEMNRKEQQMFNAAESISEPNYDDERNVTNGFEGLTVPHEIAFKHLIEQSYPGSEETELPTDSDIKAALYYDNIQKVQDYTDEEGNPICF